MILNLEGQVWEFEGLNSVSDALTVKDIKKKMSTKELGFR